MSLQTYLHFPLLSVLDFKNCVLKGVLPLPGANNQEVGGKTLAYGYEV